MPRGAAKWGWGGRLEQDVYQLRVAGHRLVLGEAGKDAPWAASEGAPRLPRDPSLPASRPQTFKRINVSLGHVACGIWLRRPRGTPASSLSSQRPGGHVHLWELHLDLPPLGGCSWPQRVFPPCPDHTSPYPESSQHTPPGLPTWRMSRARASHCWETADV